MSSADRSDLAQLRSILPLEAAERRRLVGSGEATLLRQSALADFSLLALHESDPRRLVEHAVRIGAEATGTDFCTIQPVDSRGVLRTLAGHGWPKERIGRRLDAFEAAQSQRALELYAQRDAGRGGAPQAVVIEDLRLDQDQRQTFRVHVLGVVSSVAVVIPGVWRRAYGTLVIHSCALRRFEPSECEFVQVLANLLSAALQRCNAQSLLEAGERRFQDFTELSSDWYWEQDADLRFRFVSAGFFRFIALSAKEVLGKTRWELPGVAPLHGSWEDHQALHKARLPFRDFETMYFAPDGTKRYFSTSGMPVHKAGAFAGYHGVARDITARKIAERALEESEKRYRELFESSPEAMYLFDPQTLAIVDVNQRMVDLYGWTREEFNAMSMLDLRPPQYRELVEREVRDEEGIRVTKPRRHWRRDGTHLNVEITAHKVQYGGRAVHMVIVSDLSDRERMRQALHDHRRLLARAQQLAGLGYWEFDLARKTVRGSHALQRMLGLPPGLPPQSVAASLGLVHPDDRERVRNELAASANFSFETRVLLAGVSERIFAVAGEKVRDRGGNPVKVIGTCLDITERRQREKALSDAANELQALSRRLVEAQETERRRLAAELHDQVGQNLTALSINLDILEGMLNTLGPAPEAKRRLRDSLALLEATARSIDGMLDDLRPPMLDDWGLGPTVQWIAEEFGRRSKIPIPVCEFGAERRVDPQSELALVRIVQEALNNVAKHARARKVEILIRWESASVCVDVADDGIGFETNGFGGRKGLGLLSMRERTEALHGRLEIESAPGKGTRVRASVPG